MQVRVENFNRELQDLQRKYKLVMISRTITMADPNSPRGPYSVTNHPIQVIPMQDATETPPLAPSTEATKPE